MYKIVAKLLAKRMKRVLPTIINEAQSAFIEGRHLLQSVLIANEVIDEAKRSHKSCLVFKVDYEKAYDSVSWNFLLYMLKRTGFSAKWVSWMEGCLKSASISVLVNGSPTAEFIPQRGLRQGDPLAPFLFNIVAEALNGLMRSALGANLYKGFNIASSEVSISLLQYADDTIFFGEWRRGIDCCGIGGSGGKFKQEDADIAYSSCHNGQQNFCICLVSVNIHTSMILLFCYFYSLSVIYSFLLH